MEAKLRVLFDTNVYGLVAKTATPHQFVSLVESKGAIVCGSTIIRSEIRKISKDASIGGLKLRKIVLGIYDALVDDKRNYSISGLIESIATEYYKNYSGNHSWKEMENDFLIVATASLHQIDVVISNDEKTMISKNAVSAYRTINQKFELDTPKFIKLEEFERTI
ncbi:MAG TPA: hypothetical protein VFF13_05890 [archaeon]|nr:hypothetical protein [archaeon]